MRHLVLTRRVRRCRLCRADTLWALEADLATDRGTCPDHPGTRLGRGDEPTDREAFHRLVRTFGVDRVEEMPPAPSNGPCAACRAPIVRYGPWAVSTLCVACGGSS